MIKLKKLVLENNNTIKLDDNDIEFILSYLENCYQYEHIIFRGSNHITDNYGIKKIRENRYLRNTTKSMNAIIEGYKKFTNQQNVVPDRRNCLFSSSGIDDARDYGSSVYAIFPTNDCTIKYNPVISDSLTEIYKFNNPIGAGIYRDSLPFKKYYLISLIN